MRLATKLWTLLGSSWLLAALASGFLLRSVQDVALSYQHLLSREIQVQNNARVMQVSFKKQVQEWKDALLRGSDPAALEKYREHLIATRKA